MYVRRLGHAHGPLHRPRHDDDGLEAPARCTPGPHNKKPRHKIFAKGWVAQKQIFDRYLDGCARTFQGFPRVGSGKTRIL